MSHTENIDYAIEQLQQYQGEMVIGHYLMGGFGFRELSHQILSESEAKQRSITDPNYHHITLNDLLTMKKDIQDGKYTLEDGLIISPAHSYESE